MKALFLLLIATLLTSCGYRFGRGEILERYSTVCIPFAEGDERGFFTAALIRATSTRGGLLYRSCGSDLILKVCLLEPTDTNIGFVFAPEDDGGIAHFIVSNEARLTMGAQVRLIDRRTGNCVLGPLEVFSDLDYDFEPDLSHIDENAFSLGQLEMHNLAEDEAFCPLYTLLAEKIVDYVNNAW